MIEGNYYKRYLRFYLTGSKLKGEWELRRLVDAKDERDSRDKWQLIKVAKSTRAISRKRDDESVLSKRTMAQIGETADARWESNRK